MSVIDQFWVALGFEVDDRGLKEMEAHVEAAKESLLSLGDVLVGFITEQALDKVVELNSEFESTRIAIAGLFSATGAASDFNAGLDQAGETMEYIEKISARLPGQAEEYIDVFKTGFPFVREAMPNATEEQVADFTSKFTAIGKTMKAGSDEIGIMLTRLLAAGHATLVARSPFTQQLLVSMRQVEGYAHLTVEQFNKLSQPQRLALLQKTFEKLDPMVKAFSNSWEAMWGTFKTNVGKLVRAGTGGLFNTLKDQLHGLITTFVDDKGKLTSQGEDVVDMFKTAGRVIGTLLRDGLQVVKWFMDLAKHSAIFKVALAGIGALVAGAAFSGLISKLGMIASGFRLATMLTGAMAIALGLLIEDVWTFYNGGESVTGLLVQKWAPAIYLIIGAIVALGLALSPPLTLIGAMILGVVELEKHWTDVVTFVEGGLNGWVNLLNAIIDKINTVIEAFGAKGIGHVGAFNLKTWTQQPDALTNFHAPDHFQKLGEDPDVPLWLQKPGSNRSNDAAGSSVNTNVRVGDINITAPDAKAAGREVQRVLRTAQSGMVR